LDFSTGDLPFLRPLMMCRDCEMCRLFPPVFSPLVLSTSPVLSINFKVRMRFTTSPFFPFLPSRFFFFPAISGPHYVFSPSACLRHPVPPPHGPEDFLPPTRPKVVALPPLKASEAAWKGWRIARSPGVDSFFFFFVRFFPAFSKNAPNFLRSHFFSISPKLPPQAAFPLGSRLRASPTSLPYCWHFVYSLSGPNSDLTFSENFSCNLASLINVAYRFRGCGRLGFFSASFV